MLECGSRTWYASHSKGTSKMKTITSLALIILMALSMTACGSSGGNETTPSTTESTSESTTQATTGETTAATTSPVFGEIVLVDNDDCTFKITGVDESSIWGYTLKVFLENKTDKELMFTLDNTSVNGFMCDPYWAESVAPGMKSNTTVSWFETDFEENGIETVEEIIFTLRVYDNNDWAAADILKEEFTVNP